MKDKKNKKKSSYNMYKKKLERDVADGSTPLFKWYRRIGMAHVGRKISTKEFMKLMRKGKEFEG